jgi:maltooligosyltrehalose trehalohydrolase
MHVRVWAPTHERVTLVLEARELELEREPGGYHAGFAPGVAAGVRYRFRLGDDPALVADPASRFQPEGPHGPSQLIDPTAFAWTDADWRGIPVHRHVIYEIHAGTFTPEGTWLAAAAQLPFLADLGITTVELMPIAEFAGSRNWGYDGVNLYAPEHVYGTPDDLRTFVDRAHSLGLAVILDVVYNHFGPSGNSMFRWSPYYQSEVTTDWGDAINFDGERSHDVRQFFVANAGYWIDEFHFDGLRLDATQDLHDRSPEHIIAAVTRRAREAGAGRRIFIIGENEPQDVSLLAMGIDALCNDDFHHTARVALSGDNDGYLSDYGGTPQELLSALQHGFLYQGQLYPWQKQPRGSSTRGIARRRFVHYLESHDQAANLGFGERLTTTCDHSLVRALTAVLLLGPELPMLFQGQETGSRRPWRFFVDHEEGLQGAVRDGRAEFVSQFPRLATAEAQARLSDPCAEKTFRECVLDPADRTLENPWVRLHRDLIALRSNDPAFSGELCGATLSPHAFVVRFTQEDPMLDRLLLVNLGPTFKRGAVPEPLIAPPRAARWHLAWSSEDPRYGGHGTPPVFDAERLAIPARAAVVLVPRS